MLSNQSKDFLSFIIVGIIIAFVFDIFRAYRKFKNKKRSLVFAQDIIFSLISTSILSISMIKLLDTQFRIYVIIAILIGTAIYMAIISRIMQKIIINFFKVYKEILGFIFVPISITKQILHKICKKIKKIVQKACKKMIFVISYIYKD